MIIGFIICLIFSFLCFSLGGFAMAGLGITCLIAAIFFLGYSFENSGNETYNNSQSKNKNNTSNRSVSNQVETKWKWNLKQGQEIKLGKYYIDSDGNKKGITWIVLEVNGEYALLLSKYCIDTKFYNDSNKEVTWETCTVRKWLNSDFYNMAFSVNVKQKIIDTTVINNKVLRYGLNGGNNTTDKVFLLSIEEVEKYFPTQYSRRAYKTEYAKRNDTPMIFLGAMGPETETVNWLTRSPGGSYTSVAAFSPTGGYINFGVNSSMDQPGIRPAIWIRL